MEFHFRSTASLGESRDPLLKEILGDCEMHAEITVHCSTHGDEIDLVAIEVDEVSYDPPDSTGAIRAQFLDHQGLRKSIHAALEDRVQERWEEYYHQAHEEIESMREAAMEERWERHRETGF